MKRSIEVVVVSRNCMLSACFWAVIAVFLFGLAFNAAMAQETEQTQRPASTQALIDVLKDEKARGELIRQLEQAAGEQPAPTPGAQPMPDAPSAEQSVGRQVALQTQRIAEGFAVGAMTLLSQLYEQRNFLGGLSGRELGVIAEAAKNLLLVIAITALIFFVLRAFAKRIYVRFGELVADAGSSRTILLTTASIVIDIAIVLLSWIAGYLIALSLFGDLGEIGIRQALYLNAFLLVELAKVAVRAVLSPATQRLRLVDIPTSGAQRLTRWLSFAITVIGYGQLLIVPIINQAVTFSAGRSISKLLVVIVVLALVYAVLRNRKAVANWLIGGENPAETRGIGPALARLWHLPALGYLVTAAFIIVTQPGNLLWSVLDASGKVVLVAVFAMILSNVVRSRARRGFSLPENVNHRLPLLEGRINAFVPRTLYFIRLLIILVSIGVIADLVELFDFQAWLRSQFGVRITGIIASVGVIVTASFLLWLAVTSWVDFRLNASPGREVSSREQTLLSLLRNAATIAIIVITTMFVLSEIGIDIAPLLASAGVLGLAIGFGAQKLVQDIITGIFIQLENAINVGDVITVNGTTGTVERLTIRSVSLRDIEGAFHIIPFSSVDMVSNYMREYGHYLIDMGIAYGADVGLAKQSMLDAFDELRRDNTYGAGILGELEWFGVQSFGDSAVILRARIKCRPGKQWAVGRAYNERVKTLFDKRGIEIPFPHQTIYYKADQTQKTPPQIEAEPAE